MSRHPGRSFPAPPNDRSITGRLARLFASRTLNRRDATGYRPLDQAVYFQDVDRVRQLIEQGADPSLPSGPDGSTALHLAMARRNDDLLYALLRAKVPIRVDQANASGMTALHLAVEFDCPDVVEILVISANANPNLYDADGRFPLHQAAYLGNADVIRSLLKSLRIDPNARVALPNPTRESGDSGRRAVSRFGNATAHARQGRSAANPDGETALHLAAACGVPAAVGALLSCPDLDPTLRAGGMTAAELAREWERPEIAELIERDMRSRGIPAQ